MDILLKFGSLDKMKITYSDPQYYLGKSGKGLIISLGFKTIVRSKNNKKAMYAIINTSMNYLSKIIKDYEKFTYKGYVWKRIKHEPTDNNFYIARNTDKCMIRADAFNFHIETVRTKMTSTQQIPISHVCHLDDTKSKEIIADKNL